jgi:hypothetical protein
VEEQREFRVQTHRDLNGAIGSLNQSVVAMNKLMDDLHVALTGDELGNPGVIHRQNDLQGQLDEHRGVSRAADQRLHDRIDELEEKFNRVFWLAIGVGIGSGVGTSGIIALILQASGNG